MVIYHTLENTVISFIVTCLKFDFYKRCRVAFEMTKKRENPLKKKEFENVC